LVGAAMFVAALAGFGSSPLNARATPKTQSTRTPAPAAIPAAIRLSKRLARPSGPALTFDDESEASRAKPVGGSLGKSGWSGFIGFAAGRGGRDESAFRSMTPSSSSLFVAENDEEA